MIEFSEPFVGSFAVTAGWLSKSTLRGPRFVRLFPDVYVSSAVPLSLDLRSQAARLYAGPAAVLSGYSAACFHGADCLPFQADAEVTTLRHVRPQPGLMVHRASLQDDEITIVQSVRVTTPVRTAYDLIRRLSLVDGVAVADCLARAGGFEPADLDALIRRHRGARSKRRVPPCVELLDPSAESMMESRLRVTLVLRGLPKPVGQYSVFDADGRFVARLDLAYPWAKLAIEYDGAQHRSSAAQAADLRRHNQLTALGWRVLRFCADDIYRRPDHIVSVVAAALRTAAAS